MELLRSQLVSVAEDRRRVMLWSAILALAALMLLGRVASIPWFLALVPLVLLALWQACLLVRQRRCQAAWENVLQKADGGSGSGSASLAKAGAVAASAAELGAGDAPDLLRAIASPSILIFHGLLLGAVVAGGASLEMSKDPGGAELAAKTSATTNGGGGGGCGCGGGAKAVAGAESVARPAIPQPPRNFNSAPPRSTQGPQPMAYPTRPPGGPTAGAPRGVMPGQPTPSPTPAPRTGPPAPSQTTANPAVGVPSNSLKAVPTPAPRSLEPSPALQALGSQAPGSQAPGSQVPPKTTAPETPLTGSAKPD